VPEAALIEQAQARDWGAFEQLVERYRSHVGSLARHALQDPKSAEEALQATFARAWELLPQFDGRDSFRSWLAGLCVREVVERVSPVEPGLGSPDGSVLELDEALRRAGALHRAVAAAVASLPIEHRVAFVIGEIGGAPHAEVAAALEISRADVKQRLREAWDLVFEAIESCSYRP
jgi:RNA polymerase sigma-70 factor (ECF subfamily)